MNVIKETQTLISELIVFLQGVPCGNKHIARLERLINLIEMPCELAIAGKVKAGKSSFLNALLGVDLAMVGTTETTATINFFKYGVPEDPNKPVIVYWNDGREPEPQTLEFLNSLQGHTKEILDKAEKIDHLEYLLPHPILRNVTLIDTPGIGSVEDVHEQRASDYFNPQRVSLRERHEKQSDALTERADAVVYISTPIPENSTHRFFGEFIPNISALNAIGVMSQIDRETNASPETITRMAQTLAQTFRKELCGVIPVSAGIYHHIKKLKKNGNLKILQQKLQLIPTDKFHKRFKGSDTFLQKEGAYNNFFEEYGLTYQQRLSMVGDMPWKVFHTIAKTIYDMPLDNAEKFLIDFSGMERIKQLLDKHFFSRSRVIRCLKVLKEIKQILFSLKNIDLPQLRSDAISLDSYCSFIEYSKKFYDEKILYSLKEFLTKTIPNNNNCDEFADKLDYFIENTDRMEQCMIGVKKSSEGLLLLEKYSHLLRNEEEITEIEILFGKYPQKIGSFDPTFCMKRQRAWNARIQRVQNNIGFAKLLKLVCATYGKYIT